MSDVPDVHAAVIAVARMAAEIRTALAADPDRDHARALARAAGLLVEIDTHTRWSRDAALQLARRAGVGWARLAADTGLADSTLSQRLQAWQRGDTPPEPQPYPVPGPRGVTPSNAERQLARALAEIRAAAEIAIGALREMPDPHRAFELASALTDDLAALTARAATARDAAARDVHRTEQTALAALAHRVGGPHRNTPGEN